MRVARELGKFEAEVEELLPHEIARWIAYFQIEDEENAKAAKRAATK